MASERGIGGFIKTVFVGLAVVSTLLGASGSADARDFKTVKVQAITATDFAEGCALEGGLHGQDTDSKGNVVESSCDMPDGSAVDCDWGSKECRVYPPPKRVSKSSTKSYSAELVKTPVASR
jgi:hypothetical protein